MARVNPSPARATTVDGLEGLVFVIPSKRNVFIILFLGFWLVMWWLGESSAIRQLGDRSRSGSELFMIVWLGGWTAGGAFALWTWLWTVAGRERLSLTSDALVIRRQIFGVGPVREYDLSHVSNLRVSATAVSWSDSAAALRFWGVGGGPIAFDYGSKTIRLGSSLDEAEAGQIIDRLKQRHAFA